MAHRPIVQEVEDIMEEGPLRPAIDRLLVGAKGPGVYLTERECAALLRAMPKPSEYPRWMWLAYYSLEHGERGTAAAVRKAMKKFGASRATVYKALQRRKEFFAALYSRDKPRP